MSASITPGAPATGAPTRRPWLRLAPEDGVVTLLLLVAVVYITVASIQGVTPAWAPGLQILTITTGAGLLLGYLTVQQGRLPEGLVHLLGMVVGVLFAFQQTASATLGGSVGVMWQHLGVWFSQVIIQRQSSDDNSVFLLFLAILSFLLAYISVWLVIRTRRPWLAALANGVVLLINLGWVSDDRAKFYLLLFMLATLLLLVRFTLAENVRRWRARGLRFSSDLGWDFLQAGAIFAVIVLLLGYLLPPLQLNQSIQSYLQSSQNPIQVIQNQWGRFFGGTNGGGRGGALGFSSDLRITSSVTLSDSEQLRFKLGGANDDPDQYLVTRTFDVFDGVDNWSDSETQTRGYAANQAIPSSSSVGAEKTDTYIIKLAMAPDGGAIFAPGQEAAAFSVATHARAGSVSHDTMEWSADQGQNAGATYTARGYVSTATEADLRSVGYPKEDPGAYPDGITQQYLFSPSSGAIKVAGLQAREVVGSAPTMYDAALAIEKYLHDNFHYSQNNPPRPQGVDAVSWFFKTRQGFCTSFATAMALMARAEGMAARIATGFSTYARYDTSSGSYIVTGQQSHVWTQIYFGPYGWINFEPTASFNSFTRQSATSGSGQPTPTGGIQTPGASTTPTPRAGKQQPDQNPGGPTQRAGASPVVTVGLSASAALALIGLLLALFVIWWRLLYRGLSPSAAAFARATRLGAWAGAPPRRSQTPREYAQALAEVAPGQRATFDRLSDLYARERWGGEPEPADELERLYLRARVSLTRAILVRLRAAPGLVLRRVRQRGRDG